MCQPAGRWAERIRQLKEVVPIEDVVGRYFTLVPEGTRYLRAREHDSLVVDRVRGRYHWNARGESGDVVDFLCRQEGLSLREALARLGGEGVNTGGRPRRLPDAPGRRVRRPPIPAPSPTIGRRMLRALRVAIEVYHAALLEEPAALGYLAGRGIGEDAVRQLRLGYCTGRGLIPALRRAGIPLRDARRAGLLVSPPTPGYARGTEETEFLRGRVVVPELGPSGPTWLIGRILPGGDGPRYLGLPLTRPLLGYHRVRASPVVLVTEGVFDALSLLAWGLPGVGLCGTDPGPRALAQLRKLAQSARLYLVPQSDPPGRRAAERLAAVLPAPPEIITLPSGVKDLGELAESADGKALFLAALPHDVRDLVARGRWDRP
jgi:DNA primase